MLSILMIASAAVAQPIAMPAFMTGCWQKMSRPEEGKSWTQECWMEPRGGLMLGASREGEGEKLTSWEQMRIQQSADGKLIFYASPGGRPAVAFAAEAASATSIDFVNATHDYPQRIRYELKDGRLHARISLLDGGKPVEWSYNRENR